MHNQQQQQNSNINNNQPNNQQQVQLTQQQIQLLRASSGIPGSQTGNNFNALLGNIAAGAGGGGVRVPTTQQQFLFMQQQQQQQNNQQNLNMGQSPNLIPNQMQVSNSPNMVNNLMGGLSNGIGNSGMHNLAMNAQNLGLNPQQQQMQTNPMNSNHSTAASSPQLIAQMLQGISPQQQLYLAHQQQYMQQNMLMNPQQLAQHQQNQLLFSNNQQNGNSSPSIQSQQINQMFVRQMAKPKNTFTQPQNTSASPNLAAQQLFAHQLQQQQQQQQNIRPINIQQINNQVQPNTGNPAMVNMTMMQHQRSINHANNIRPRPLQQQAIRQNPNMQLQQQQQYQANQPPQQVPIELKSPLFHICPQQSSKIFSFAPLHGLIDLQASIHGGYNPTGGSSVNLDGNSISGSAVLGVAGTPVQSAQNIVKGLHDANGMRFKEGPGRFDDGSRPEKRNISSLLEELDGECTLDADAERCLLQFADDFLNQVIMHSAKIAKHAQSTTLQVKDIQLELEHNWNIRIPGFEGGITETETAPKKSLAAAQLAAMSSHSQATAHNIRLLALAKAKRETMLKNGVAYLEKEREAAELASIYELANGDGCDDIGDELVDVVEDEDGDVDGPYSNEGDIGNGVYEASEDFGATPNEALLVDSPLIEIAE